MSGSQTPSEWQKETEMLVAQSLFFFFCRAEYLKLHSPICIVFLALWMLESKVVGLLVITLKSPKSQGYHEFTTTEKGLLFSAINWHSSAHVHLVMVARSESPSCGSKNAHLNSEQASIFY